ncbi:MAG: FtsX-like permease family protein, partial [Dehalococcoidia bacterium]
KGWADHHRNSGGWAILMLIVGLLATWWGGWIAQQAFAYTAGTTLVMFAIAMLAVYFGAAARPTFAAMSALVIWYWLLPLPFSLFFEGGKGWTDPLDGFFGLVGLGHAPIIGNIEMFFVSGVCITAASTLFVIFNADRLLGAMGLLQSVFGGITPAIRTAVSYPLAAKFRTGMTLAMFTLVMFSLVVMSTLNYNFTQLFLGEAAQGGFQVQANANRNNPIPDLRAALADAGYDVDANIEAVGRLTGGGAEVRPANEAQDELYFYRLAGLDAEFLDTAAFPMSTTASGYAGTEAVLEALATDPTVAVANESVLSFTQRANFMNPDTMFSIEGAIADFQDTPWEPIPVTVVHPDTGEERTVRIIGFVDSAIMSGVVPQWIALFVNDALVADLIEEPAQSFFVNTVDGSDQAALDVAAGIESTLLERGMQADSLQQRVQDSAAQSNAFSTLFEAFMSLGLIVGIAALGVIAFRTVAERRQQIGMLRAIGYSRRLVAISFFLESSFIALTGIGMGLVLGAALSYNLMTSPEFTNGAEIDFGIPWVRLLIIVGVAYLATALMTLIPARSASRVSVAEALRYSA